MVTTKNNAGNNKQNNNGNRKQNNNGNSKQNNNGNNKQKTTMVTTKQQHYKALDPALTSCCHLTEDKTICKKLKINQIRLTNLRKSRNFHRWLPS